MTSPSPSSRKVCCSTLFLYLLPVSFSFSVFFPWFFVFLGSDLVGVFFFFFCNENRPWTRSHATGCRKSWWSGRWIRRLDLSIKLLIICKGFCFFFFPFHLSEELEFIYLINSAMNGVYRWVIEVNGAPGTLYANETYQLQVDFPEHYPMEAPQVKCITFSFCLCSISLFV